MNVNWKVLCCGAVLVGIAITLASCRQAVREGREVAAIVGVWVVTMPEAPFPVHMIAFHADGTVVQSNPDAGHATSSDSSAMGVWVRDGDAFRGKMVEITADRTTRKFARRGEISFNLKVNGDVLNGKASAMFYDAGDHPVQGPINVTMQGKRVAP
jgi:hypothetical protein